jgi:hypothetical protein
MEKIAIELPVNAWNVVMNALGQRPFAEVAELIAEIKRQGEAKVNTVDPTPAE